LNQNGLLDQVTLPSPSNDKAHVFNNYVIRAKRRDQLKQFLAEKGIQSEIYYPLPLHLQKCFTDLGHRENDFPQAERAAREVLALPLYPELTLTQQEEVVQSIQSF
jgi:dTDP-4-amino-4,6-dideoxygalactose transaminase